MTSASRRFEILLPRKFNDGTPVPDELFTETLSELEQRFSAVSVETQIIHGRWRHEGEVYHDEIVRVFIDAIDLPEHHDFFVEYKEELKERFQQVDVWVTSHLVDVL